MLLMKSGPEIADFPPEELASPQAKKEITKEELASQLMSSRDSSLPQQRGLGMN